MTMKNVDTLSVVYNIYVGNGAVVEHWILSLGWKIEQSRGIHNNLTLFDRVSALESRGTYIQSLRENSATVV